MASDNFKCGSPLFPPRPPSGAPRIMPPSRPPFLPRVPVLTVNGEGPDRSGNVVVEPPDLGGKADKVANPTDGNFAGLDGSGNLVDSGSKASDFQPRLSFDGAPAEGSQNPVTSDGIARAIAAAAPGDYEQVKAQVGENADGIAGIEAVVPNQASAQNQLADKEFVNSSIATNTATFRGTYNLVSDLGLAVPATEQQVAAAIAAKLASLVPPVVPENNDYCFVQVPYDEDPVDPEHVERIDRYKCTVAESGGAATRTWGYEFSLNNSSFTAVQWAAINSGITSALAEKLGALPTATDLAAALLAKYEKPPTGIPKTDLSAGVQASLGKADTALQSAPVTSINNKTGAVQIGANDVGALPNSGNLMLDGSISASGFLAALQLIVGTSRTGAVFTISDSDHLYINVAVKSDGNTVATYKFPLQEEVVDAYCFARLGNFYAAVRQIAPAWASGTPYAADAPVSYNGVLYQNTSGATIQGAAPPNIPGSGWTAKKVSELFLPLTGGAMTGPLILGGAANAVYAGGKYAIGINWQLGSNTGILFHEGGPDETLVFATADRLHGQARNYGTGWDGANLQDIASPYSTSLTYAQDKLCVHDGALYRCTTAITTAEAWTSAHWTKATVEDVLAAIRSVLDGKAPLASPAFAGTPTAPTPTAGDNSTNVATTAFVRDAVANKLDGEAAAPGYDPDATYDQYEHVTYNGRLYYANRAIAAPEPWTSAHWTEDDMTSPDATLDITAAGSLRVVAADGTLLWQQGYKLASASSATLSNEGSNLFVFAAVAAFDDAAPYEIGDVVAYDGVAYVFTAAHAAGAWIGPDATGSDVRVFQQSFSLPATPSGRAGDYVLTLDNTANTCACGIYLAEYASETISLIVPKGRDLNEMFTIEGGARCELYFTMSPLAVDSKPTWKIVRQDVEVVA